MAEDRIPSRLLSLYRASGTLLRPGLDLMHAVRVRRGKEDPDRRGERHGIASLPRPDGPVAWVHASSVGETNSALQLIADMTRRGIGVVLTTGTVTSAEIARAQLPPGAVHQYVPYDIAPYVSAFLDTWRPDLAVLVESEVWPLTLSELGNRSIPVVVVNGRMSQRSAAKWRRFRSFSRQVFCNITLCLTQSDRDAELFAELGAGSARAVGNLKFDRQPPAFDPCALDALRAEIGDRLVWIAASTHAGEEALALQAHGRILQRAPDALLILAPRHPARGEEIAALAARAGHTIAVRSRHQSPGRDATVYLADTIGELGLLYRLAALAFVGGSFADRGGQNPVEPAQLGVPVIHGPRVRNFQGIYRDLDQAGGAQCCPTREDFVSRVVALAFDEVARAALADNARRHVAGQRGALGRTVDALTPFLLPLARPASDPVRAR